MTDTNWITRPELGERLRIPEKTLAQWAVKKTGPPYAKFRSACPVPPGSC
jgi:hypothetical protein